MFFIPPSPKQLSRLGKSSDTSVSGVPKKWADFAPMLQIRSGKGYKAFTPFDFQLELDRLVSENSFIALAKTRQTGASEYAVSKVLHECLLNPGMNSLVVSRTGLDSGKLARRLRTMLDGLGIKPTTDNLNDVIFPNGSRIVFSAPGDSSGRGENSVAFVVIDEFSFLREPELTLGAALPATSMIEAEDLKILLIFTPNGKQHFSYQLLDGKNPPDFDLISTINKVRSGDLPGLYHWKDDDLWVKILLHWRAHPIYSKDSENYLKDVAKKQKISWRKVVREYDLSFDESETQFISDEIIRQCTIGSYSEPEDGAAYFCGLDSSTVGSDYFCFSVVKQDEGKLSLVHLYRARRRAMKRHLERIKDLIDRYNPIAGCIEVNSFGQLYYEALAESKPMVQWQRFSATHQSNIAILERLLMKMEAGSLIFPSDADVLRELRGLEANPVSGRIAAGSSGSEFELHDDIPRSLALSVYSSENRNLIQLPTHSLEVYERTQS